MFLFGVVKTDLFHSIMPQKFYTKISGLSFSQIYYARAREEGGIKMSRKKKSCSTKFMTKVLLELARR
jgi:hypothetical protein